MGRRPGTSPDRRHFFALLLALSVCLAACASTFGGPAEPPLAYRQAEDAFRRGDYDRAARNYRVFLEHEEEAALAPRAYLQLARAEFGRGQEKVCLDVLDEMVRRYPDELRPEVCELRAMVDQSRDNPISALHWLELGWNEAHGEQRRRLWSRMEDIVDRMPPEALKRAEPVLETFEVRGLVRQRLESSLARGPSVTATPASTKADAPTPAVSTPTPSAVPTAAASLRVACLLPLSGPYANFGDRSLKGLRLALGPLADRLIVRDTGGQAETARAAVDALIADPEVGIVVGPLRSDAAESVAPRAEHAGLPTLLLSQREGLTGRFVFQMALTQQDQAAELAAYAADVLRLRRFAIVYPNDGYGVGLAEAFRREATRRGGRMAGMVPYVPGTRAFPGEAQEVARLAEGGERLAVFLPDHADAAVPLAAEIRRVRPDLTLLGSSGWNDPAKFGEAAPLLQGAVFVDGFFVNSQRMATRRFVSDFEATHHGRPSILEAQAYDAGLVARAVIEAGTGSRADVIPRLRSVRLVDGATGRMEITANGIRRRAVVLRVAGGGFEELDGEQAAPR